jgi:FdhD protein
MRIASRVACRPEDFAVGFSLSEGIVAAAGEIASLDVVRQQKGIELRLWLTPDHGRNFAERRRRIAGPTGCGLCGVESLEAAVPACPRVSVGPSGDRRRPRGAPTRAGAAPAHGAAFGTSTRGLVALTEDVGRHNAFDKLIGRLHRQRVEAGQGIVLLTSRVSVEMVQKAAVAGAPVLVAISAPTALALETAERSGITLVAVARADGFEVFTHPHRIAGAAEAPSLTDETTIEIEHAA